MSDYRALYRKWRPYDFDDVWGQDGITEILKYQVNSGKLSHAYLFCGSRGTGKTSCAKILAKAVNCLNIKNGNPCNECSACRSIDAGIATDVIEMDAASNNGVDNVRALKDEIAFTPAELKYRVYIIDEVHMMSQSAFNALLKTLEEPPTYVVFILATTEYHKLPTTIVSRCQRFDFKRISSQVIIDRLKHISSHEGIDITEDGARVIARASRGGMRDAVSLLELAAGSRRTVDAELVFSVIGSGNRENSYKIVKAVLDKNYSEVYKTVSDVVSSSGDLSVFWQEIIDAYRDIMVVKNTDKAKDYLDLTELEYTELCSIANRFTSPLLSYHLTLLEGAIGDMQRSVNSKRAVAEIALTRMCDAKTSDSYEALVERVSSLEKELSILKLGGASVRTEDILTTVVPTPEATCENTKQADKKEEKETEQTSAPYSSWDKVLDRVGELKCSLSVQFMNSTAQRVGESSFLIKMNSFFANQIVKKENDLALLRGVIAEIEGKEPSKIRLAIESLDGSGGSLFSELLDGN